ncbi:MAG: TfoX/Sxy family protein [Rickettsiales bacterium]
MIDDNSFINNVLDQLADVDGITTRRMFGGVGIFRLGYMFAIVADDRLYFKVDEENKPDYQAAGSAPFIYDRHDVKGEKKLVAMSYWEVPPDIFEDRDALFRWMVKAHEAAIKSKHKEIG